MQRRDFVTASVAASIFRQTASAADPIRTGMIGTGNRGTYVLGVILQQPDVKVTALCDLKPDRLDRAASLAARDNPATVGDYRQLLARKDVDAVFIDTPCDLHVEMAMAALQAGKHVYCEKPAGITPESIGRLIKAVRASDRLFCIGQQMRSYEGLKRVVERLHEGIAGDILMVKAQRHAATDLAHDGLSADWFFDARRSGDVINEMVVHNLDVCNWIIGSHPESAAGFGGTLLWKNDPPGRTNMDGYTLSYDYPKNVKLSFTQVFFHPSGLPGPGQYYYVYGTKGAVDVLGGKFYPRESGGKPETILEPARERGDELHVAAFFDAVRTGGKPPAGIDIGATAALTAILGREAIYRKTVMNWTGLGIDI
jgi:myo-inositol 2-dehydrogenase/D-chiro-inositol 1-dehydrogenase